MFLSTQNCKLDGEITINVTIHFDFRGPLDAKTRAKQLSAWAHALLTLP